MVATLRVLLPLLLTTGALAQWKGLLRVMGAGNETVSTDPVYNLLKEHRIIGEVLDDFTPTVNVSFSFGDKDFPINSQIAPADAKAAPKFTFTPALKAGTMYTVLMTDPGVLGTFSRKNAWQWLHYIVVNEEATKEGKIVMDYSGPNPPQGNHRYVMILFEQTTGAIAPTSPKNTNDDRGNFNTREFAQTNGLKPLGATFFYSQNPKLSRRGKN